MCDVVLCHPQLLAYYTCIRIRVTLSLYCQCGYSYSHMFSYAILTLVAYLCPQSASYFRVAFVLAIVCQLFSLSLNVCIAAIKFVKRAMPVCNWDH